MGPTCRMPELGLSLDVEIGCSARWGSPSPIGSRTRTPLGVMGSGLNACGMLFPSSVARARTQGCWVFNNSAGSSVSEEPGSTASTARSEHPVNRSLTRCPRSHKVPT